MAVIGSHEFARGLRAELEAVGVKGYEVIGCIDPKSSCDTADRAGVRCLGSLVLLRSTVLDQAIELLVLGPLSSAERDESDQRHGVSPRGLRAGRRRLPRPAGVADRVGTAL